MAYFCLSYSCTLYVRKKVDDNHTPLKFLVNHFIVHTWNLKIEISNQESSRHLCLDNIKLT